LRNLVHIVHFKLFFTRFVLVAGVLLWGMNSFAQQDPMYTQYMENLQTVNPAYAGSKDLLSVMVVARNQWVSLPGAPDTRTLAAHSPISTTNMGLGFSLLSDHIGPVKQTGFYVDYSYRLYFSKNRTLALGLKAGVNFYDASLKDLTTNDPNDPVFANDINRSFLPNFGIGAFFYTNKYYFGLSVPKFIENTINENGVTVQNTSREKLHLFFMTGYVFDVNRIVKFKPSILAKYVKNAPVSVDLSGTVLFYNRLWLGTMLRLGDSVGGVFQLQVTDQIKIGYSYDFPTNKLGAYNNGTHEVMISYDFNPKNGRIRSPRYF
jgi:type IX secretion system PorP/SprF family membrane protein